MLRVDVADKCMFKRYDLTESVNAVLCHGLHDPLHDWVEMDVILEFGFL